MKFKVTTKYYIRFFTSKLYLWKKNQLKKYKLPKICITLNKELVAYVHFVY